MVGCTFASVFRITARYAAASAEVVAVVAVRVLAWVWRWWCDFNTFADASQLDGIGRTINESLHTFTFVSLWQIVTDGIATARVQRRFQTFVVSHAVAARTTGW